MKGKLILIGAGGHCMSCVDVIEQSDAYNIIGILDNEDMVDQTVLGYSVIGTDKDIAKFVKEGCWFLVTVGQIRTPQIRQRLFSLLLSEKASIAKIISPRAYVSKYARVGVGSIVMHDALINSGAVIGDNCIINTKALIEHGSIVENNCHISTGAVVNGDSVIKQGTFFGSNAISQEGAVTGEADFIKSASLLKTKLMNNE